MKINETDICGEGSQVDTILGFIVLAKLSMQTKKR